jgi:hypothetical protein
VTVVLNRPAPIGVRPDREKSPVGAADRRRELVVAIDRSSVRSSAAVDLIIELASAGHAELWTTGSDDADMTVNIGVGYADPDSIPVTNTRRGGGGSYTAIWPKVQWETDIAEHVEQTGEPISAVRGRFLAAAALLDEVDALVVADVDFGGAQSLAKRANPMLPEDACALLGLVLRLRGQSGAPIPFNEFQFLVSRALLPAGWRWFSACLQSSRAGGDEATSHIAQSAFERVARALLSRDRCLEATLWGHGRGAADSAAYYFDVELLMLSSGLDSIAQVGHQAHSVPGDLHSVGWRRKEWRRNLAKAAPALWSASELNSPARDAIEIVALLRNTIHGEGMRQVAVQASTGIEGHLGVSKAIAARLEPTLERHGGAAAWGLRTGDSSLIAPAPFCQRLLPMVTTAMDELMALTDVERLAGVQPASLMTAGPSDGWFDPTITSRILLLAGLN